MIDLGPKGKRYKIYDPGGGGRVAKSLRSGKPYEYTVLYDMRGLKLSGVGIDVGANIGNHSLWLAAVCGLKVEAFEPIKLNKLRANIALNDLEDQITVHSVALGAEPASAHLIGKNQLDPTGGDFEVHTLDSYGFTDVSILKVDVEGMDADVIEGGLETIEANQPVVYAEAWDDEYRSRINALLKPLGYRHAKSFRWNQNKWVPS